MTEEDSNALAPPLSTASIKAVIEQFFQERLEPRLKKLKPEDIEGREKLLADNRAENWIPNAATRVEKITQATHAIKYSHPEAKGSSLFSYGNTFVDELPIGTRSLKGKVTIDVVCDAKQLDVYKFLSLPVGDKTLLTLMIESHPAVADALSPDPILAARWTAKFTSWANNQSDTPPEKYASHSLAKQIYWPVGGTTYHLLASLFPTSLVHAIWEFIRNDNLAEKDERDAKRRYRKYPRLAVQHFGGDSGKQNISQLNAKRHGENYLLPALPPNWQSPAVRPPFAVNSVFDRIFGNRPRVRELVRTLRAFLESVVDYNNLAIREKRAELTAYLCDEALLYAAELRDAVETGELAAGWTLDERCQLNRAEQLWLDPFRGEDDPDFASEYQRDEWPDEICRRFGNWLNARLTTDKLPMSTAEAEHWRKELRREIADHE